MKKLRNEELNRKSVEEFRKAGKIPVLLVLDHLRSLNNVGSIFRTADAFLVEKIYLCGITACPPHREIQKTALGATESVIWEYREETPPLIEQLKEGDIILFPWNRCGGLFHWKNTILFPGKSMPWFWGMR